MDEPLSELVRVRLSRNQYRTLSEAAAVSGQNLSNYIRRRLAAEAPGMPARIDAIAQGAGKCDPQSLNSAFAATAYRYRKTTSAGGDAGEITTYDVHPIATVNQSALPGYCVSYNDHAWTYDLSVKYVGEPLKGGYWVKAKDFSTEQARWHAEHGGQWASGWTYSWNDPRSPLGMSHGN